VFGFHHTGYGYGLVVGRIVPRVLVFREVAVELFSSIKLNVHELYIPYWFSCQLSVGFCIFIDSGIYVGRIITP
jgi:hypothetical protein